MIAVNRGLSRRLGLNNRPIKSAESQESTAQLSCHLSTRLLLFNLL